MVYKLIEPDKTKGNGIKCPDCGEELYDSAPGLLLMSHPPQKRVACTSCEHTGTEWA